MALGLGALTDALNVNAMKAYAAEYGVAGAGLVGTLWAAKMAATKLGEIGLKPVLDTNQKPTGKFTDKNGKDAQPGQGTIPAWATPVVIVAGGMVAYQFTRKSSNAYVRRLGQGVAMGSLVFGAVQLAKALTDKQPDTSSVKKFVDALPLAGVNEAVGYPVGYLAAAPVSVETVRQLAGAPVTVTDVTGRLAALPVNVNPTQVYSTNRMSRQQAATLG